MKVICVSGTPGTGKTTLSKKLAKELDYYYIDVNNIISRYKLVEGYDRKRKTKVVDIAKLNKKLIKIILFFKKYNFIGDALLSRQTSKKTLNKLNITKNQIKKYKGIIIDSHLSHYLPKKYIDLCIVTKCGIDELNKRLKKKRFYKDKIKENLQAEIFDICYNEALHQKHEVLVIDTTKGFNINSLIHKLGG
ncbi:adenylate kinase family protein [Candidatus Woesearchaeota archaeon]|nr:adenylate kinase family protein [Candidatus Woesearchaeota archaeon]